jgi:peptidoglycan/LPS O-acetylase OafA/YrhL
MFGTWRTLLALEVVAFHFISLPVTGPFAVVSFFVLSGFLMSVIMHETYGYSPSGVARFLGNRALRLWPSLCYACLLSLALIALVGVGFTRQLNPAMTPPTTVGEWLSNLTAIYPSVTPIYSQPRLSPASWALTVEILFYVAIALGASRWKRGTLAWLGLSAAYFAWAFLTDAGLRSVYGSLFGGTLAFSAGSAAYHYRHEIAARLGRRALWWLLAARYALIVVLVPLVALKIGDWRVREIGNVLNVALSVGIVIGLYGFKADRRIRKIDKLIGDYSYPIYLLQWQAGVVAAWLMFGKPVHGPTVSGLVVFAVALPVVAAFASVSVFLIDRNIERLRAYLRHRPEPLPERSAESVV